LRNSGYVEGQNLLLERRTAEGKAIERTRAIAEDLINRKVDVIVVGTTRLARETKRATNEVPIVIAASVDPVAMGVVPNLARPGGNVTGFSAQAGPEIDAKRLQLLKEAVPKISSVAFLGTGADREMPNANALRDAAHALGLRFLVGAHVYGLRGCIRRDGKGTTVSSVRRDPTC
jgi:putative ABC transport system substrate-binding protein